MNPFKGEQLLNPKPLNPKPLNLSYGKLFPIDLEVPDLTFRSSQVLESKLLKGGVIEGTTLGSKLPKVGYIGDYIGFRD